MVKALHESREELRHLCKMHGVLELYVFGSSTTEEFEAGKSDFDFLVRFQPCTPAEHADHYFGLLHGLEDLLRSPVDLIEADAVTNTYFRQEVEATRVPLYAVESLLA
jgi:predicted nucleotidyltransferase